MAVTAPTLTIAGTSREYLGDALVIEDRIRERSILNVVVSDSAGSLSFARGHEVTLTNSDGSTRFGGHISRVATVRQTAGGGINHELSCVDYAAMADKRVASESYASSTVRTIAADLLENYLAEEGIVGWDSQWLECDGATDRAISDLTTNLSGDLDIRARIVADDYTPTAIKCIAAHCGASGDRSWEFYLDTTGKLGLRYSTDGTNWAGTDLSTVTLGSATTLVDGTTEIWVRVTLDKDNGASGRSVAFYYSTDEGVTWTQLGTTVTTAGTVTLYTTTANMSVAVLDNSPTFSDGWDGHIYEVEFRDGIGGTLDANPRFDTYYRMTDDAFEWDEGDSSADDEQGNTWTLGGDAAITRTWAIDTGDTIGSIVFDYVTVAAALDRLSERVQWWWNIDSDKVLRLKPRTDTAAPVAASPATNIEKVGLVVELTNPQYRNRQYVRGARAKTSTQTEEFAGDGERITFNVAYPVAEAPTVETNIGGAGYTSKTIGIRGVDTGKDFYWSKGTAEISQDTGGTVLTSSDLLKVQYKGLYDIVILSVDDAEIVTKKTAEGGSGKFDSVVDDATIETSDDGHELAASLLAQYGSDQGRLKFDTKVDGFAPGQLLTVNGLDTNGIATGATLLIEEVTSVHLGAGVWIFTVRALEGPPGMSWQAFYRFLIALGGREQISSGAEEVVAVLDTSSEGWTWTETSVTDTVHTIVYPGSSLYPGAAGTIAG